MQQDSRNGQQENLVGNNRHLFIGMDLSLLFCCLWSVRTSMSYFLLRDRSGSFITLWRLCVGGGVTARCCCYAQPDLPEVQKSWGNFVREFVEQSQALSGFMPRMDRQRDYFNLAKDVGVIKMEWWMVAFTSKMIFVSWDAQNGETWSQQIFDNDDIEIRNVFALILWAW